MKKWKSDYLNIKSKKSRILQTNKHTQNKKSHLELADTIPIISFTNYKHLSDKQKLKQFKFLINAQNYVGKYLLTAYSVPNTVLLAWGYSSKEDLALVIWWVQINNKHVNK